MGTSLNARSRLTAGIFALAFLTAAPRLPAAEAPPQYDVVVMGGTASGIAAAVSAARLGSKVILVDENRHLGGMASSGLGKSDIEHRPFIQGFFREFVDRVKKAYSDKYGPDSENVKLSRDGYYYEPSVAGQVFQSFVDECQLRLTLLPSHAFLHAVCDHGRMQAIVVQDLASGTTQTISGRVFIDATYEGDVFASAGAKFRLGREGRDVFGEAHAGQIYFDWLTKTPIGGTGEGDDRLQTYSYRLCLSTVAQNQSPLTQPPPDYDRTRYLGYVQDLESGRFGKKADLTRIAFSIAAIPNGKTDVNMNPRSLGFAFVGENTGYIEADLAGRQKIRDHLRDLTLGLLWFLQNDPSVPEASRLTARKYHLAKDEFTDNENFPFQLYVREGRRLLGEYTLTEHDITRQGEDGQPSLQPDAIAVGEFPIDSFPYQKRNPNNDHVLEGYLCMLSGITRPYQIPYRIMVPEKIDGLLVPVAASTSHVAFGSIRMEPTWMALGQAAGIAASLADQAAVEPRAIDIATLQTALRQAGAVLDIPQP
ncbi:FAD-dependent oxidoreductase [soil metagenome]